MSSSKAAIPSILHLLVSVRRDRTRASIVLSFVTHQPFGRLAQLLQCPLSHWAKRTALAYGCVLEYGTPRLPEMVGFALVPLQTNRAPVSGYQQKHRNGTPCELSSSTAGWGNAAPVLTGKEAGSRAKEVVVICLNVSPQQWSNRNPQKQNKFNRKPPKWSSIDSLMKIMSSKGWAKKAGGVDLGFPRTTPG